MRLNAAWFATEAERLARLCSDMAERFGRGGRLLATGDVSDSRHVAVEFVHPVIVGKRALPGARRCRCASSARSPGPTTWSSPFGVEIPDTPALRIDLAPPVDDPFIRQELVETAYHVLWELVHVFIEHNERTVHDTGAASFLYPFLGERETDHEAVVEDVRRSILMKAEEIGELRTQTLTENGATLEAAAQALRSAPRVLALGNGGSATDATDFVADLVRAGHAAIDLSADPAILTAIANDVGVEAIFARQVIAYGQSGDALVALSTSGGSGNVISALREARSRGLATVAFVGYDGGEIAASRLADHVVVVRSQHIPRIQEAQASAYHVALRADRMIHATFRGIVGAMAMTGIRMFAQHLGLIRDDPPARLARKQAKGLLKSVPRKRRGAVVELIHWAMGARSAFVFGLLPERVRMKPWSGPLYGVLTWLGFDAVIAPALGLKQRRWPHGAERAVFIVDHLLFGLVLSELRSRPRE